ncbi:MAG TPA: alpha-L-rhamnosidase C-terminal domain-containing protein [Puia sp.]|nr:alpha-L-rhamnosidase C-terminal domain-containing protein [Puia sp.]
MTYLFRSLTIFTILLGGLSCFSQTSQSGDRLWEAKWIGIPAAEKDTNLWTVYRKEFFIDALPKRARTGIATDSKYWLWVNGKMVVFEGQLKRGPNPRDTYYDELDLAPYLEKGKNTIAILAWYWGRDGFDHKSSGKPALLFEADLGNKKISSDATWKAIRHPAFGNTGGILPNFRLPEYNVYFDARHDLPRWNQPGFDDRTWMPVTEYGLPPLAPWNNLAVRPIPFWKDSGLLDYVSESQPQPDTGELNGGKLIVAQLPKNITITPYLKIAAHAGLKIDMRTDNYKGGSEYNVRAEYITKEGIQEFETFGYMNGHEVLYRIPAGVKVLALKYRETRFNTERIGEFSCDNPFYNTLWQKSFNTLNVNLRDAIQDPDRERAQWWGDAVILMGEIFYSCDHNGFLAIQKAIHNLVDWQKPDGVLYSPVPSGPWDKELPAQMLASIGRYGFWNYYRYTGDTALIRYVYPSVKKYVLLWEMGKDGLVVHRPGGWDWLDWGDDIDAPVIDNAWYYMALDAASRMAELTKDEEGRKIYEARYRSIEENYNKNLWKDSAYRSPENKGVIDDRGNGLAVVAGLADSTKFSAIKKVLRTEFHASPYMEKYILESFFIMHDARAGLERMKKRYANMVDSKLSTLWEGWGIGSEGYGGGSYNHGWAGGPLTLLSQYVAGIGPEAPAYATFHILPQPGGLQEIHSIVPTIKGKISVDYKREEEGRVRLSVTVPIHTTATVGVPRQGLDAPVISVNGMSVMKNGKPIGDNPSVRFTGVDDQYFLFAVRPGRWNFTAQDQRSTILLDKENRTLTLSDSSGSLILRLNYAGGCSLENIRVKGVEVTGSGKKVYSGIRAGNQTFTSMNSSASPALTIDGNSIHVGPIRFGQPVLPIEEEWTFTIRKKDIQWRIDRRYGKDAVIDENDFPRWEFNSMTTWDGALLDNGGVAWNRFLDRPGDVYGMQAGALTFWNKTNNCCFRVTPKEDPAAFRTATFHHQPDNSLSVAQSSSSAAVGTKVGLRRFLQTGQPVFAAVRQPGTSIQYTLQALSYDREYSRGDLKGIKASSVNEMLNTIGRYGVVDKYLYGSNGWRTGWVVTQEPWLALFGLAIDAPDFINGFSQALDYERKEAIMPDGRVLPRWHHDSTDAMPNTFRKNGFYECQWGYMLDAQPAYAIDVAEQFDMTGDITWLRRFKPACEKVLAYMTKRDADGNGLFEVIQNTYKENKGADWMDVVWASYEVSSINAYMYKALTRWSELEGLLGDKKMSGQYQRLALKLKTAFNKDITDGGFWDPVTKSYVHWREKDGSVYGNNLGCMTNFLAIGYGLCEDEDRKDAILDRMEELMQKEKLFIWPSCFFPYEDSVGLLNVNYPYPNYENGDLFLSWAELGTRCYAQRHPAIALKYIRNVIDRYEADGLGHQRYTRLQQTGAGDDILSNNIMAVVGLYRNIYGIRPQYNRLYLEPHLTPELDGTRLKYWLRGQDYTISLSNNDYSISVNHFSVTDHRPFAVHAGTSELEYFSGNSSRASLKISGTSTCSLSILQWEKDDRQWKETGNASMHHVLQDLEAHATYQLFINDQPGKKYTADEMGLIRFDGRANNTLFKMIKVQP